MDEASKSASLLLNELQTSWHKLGDISDPWRPHAHISKPYILLHGDSSIWMGIRWQREFRSMESLNFEINLMWDKDYWYIQTDVSEETDDDWKILRTFPERQTDELETCLEYIRQAIQDIASCGDIVMARVKKT